MRFIKGAGRESNLLSHVLHHGSRACIVMFQKDRRGYGQRTAANRFWGATLRNGDMCRWDLHPHHQIQCTPNRQSVWIQWATKYLSERYCSTVELRPHGLQHARWRRLDSNQQPMYSDRQSPFVFLIKAQRSCYRDVSFSVNVVPACSWACTMTIQRGKRFRRSSS